MENRTKDLIADQLEILVAEGDFEKVRIKELCRRCGIERATFYYHFHDKYDLVAWIFDREFAQASLEARGSEPVATFAATFERMAGRRDFWRKVFADRSRYSISCYLQTFNVSYGRDAVLQLTGAKVLSEARLLSIQHTSFGNIGCTIDWLFGKTPLSPLQFAELLVGAMPDFLREALAFRLEKR